MAVTAEDVPAVVRPFRRADYLKITVLGLGTSALWGSLHSVVLPLRLPDLVGESQKNTYLGLLTLTGLLLAMAYQPIAGAISDRSRSGWGRRRPFILAGSLASILLLPGIGLAGSYAAIFLVYCLLQISSNTAQGPYQALIPDLAPEQKRGVASAVKSLLELAGGMGLVYGVVYFSDLFLGQGGAWLQAILIVLAAILLATMLVTVITVRERPARITTPAPLFPTLLRSYRIDVRRSPGFVTFLVSRLLFVMALTTLQTFSLYFFQDAVKVSNPATATVQLLGVIGAGMAASVYPAGRLSDRIGRKPVLVSSGFIGAVGILLLLLRPGYACILAGGGLQGVAVGAFMSSNWALATDLVPKREEARYMGLTNLATAGGAALARLIGLGIDFFNGYSAGLGYQFMLLVCFVYFVAGSALVSRIRTARLAEPGDQLV